MQEESPPRRTLLTLLRTYFLDRAGGYRADLHHLLSCALVCRNSRQLVHAGSRCNTGPESYLPIELPGTGLVLALVVLTIIGGLTANFGRTLLSFSDRVIRQMPVVGSVYTALKQIFQTAMREDDQFSQVALIEYPRRGLHAIAFVTKTADIRVNEATGEEMISVFLPTTPNPTRLHFSCQSAEIKILDMTVEEGARLVISAGLADKESSST